MSSRHITCPTCSGPKSRGAAQCNACRLADKKMNVLYRFFDSKNSLLYVGITNQLGARIKQHERNKSWWGDVTHATMEHYESYSELATAEAVAIKNESPRYNSTFNSKSEFWDAAIVSVLEKDFS